jgi:thioredoxin-dependent peroxiredoxin
MQSRTLRGLALTSALFAAPLAAQEANHLAVGQEAPDFSLTSATQDGIQAPVKLSDYRGQTVVLAFFFKARTKG